MRSPRPLGADPEAHGARQVGGGLLHRRGETGVEPMSAFFRGLLPGILESLSPRGAPDDEDLEGDEAVTAADVQAVVDLLVVDVGTASAALERVEKAFDAVALGVYKASKGMVYYDSAAEVEEAKKAAAAHLVRVQHAAEGASKLLSMYNAFVPWVLKKCRGRLQDIEKLIQATEGRGGKAAAATLNMAREQAADIGRAVQCLEANVDEARTFLGKVGKTEEGAHDSGFVELVGADMIEAATARRSKQKRARAGSQRRHQKAKQLEPVRQRDDKIFFQRQRGAFCGVCAMNNMLGRREISYRQSELLADSIWLRSVLSHGCGVHFPAPRLHSRRREFPFDGFIDFATMHKLCLLHGLRLRELSRTDARESVDAMRNGLELAARQDLAESARVVPLLLVLLGGQKHYVCLCARRAHHFSGRGAGSVSAVDDFDEDDNDWDEICRLCGRSGELICCDGDGCTQAYHSRCIHFQPKPDELWLCPDCRTKKTTHKKLGDGFIHEAELVWMDSQIERPISERILAVDRRAAGRNAALFDSFVLAARAQEGSYSVSKAAASAETAETDSLQAVKTMRSVRSKATAAAESEWDKGHEFVGARARYYLGGEVFNGSVAGFRILASTGSTRRGGAIRDQAPVVFRFEIDDQDDENQLGFLELEEGDAREAIDAAMALKFHNGSQSHRGAKRNHRTAMPAATKATKSKNGDTKPANLQTQMLRVGDCHFRLTRVVFATAGGLLTNDPVEDLRKLLHPSSPEQIVVFAVDNALSAVVGEGEHERVSFDSLFGDFPNDLKHSPMFASSKQETRSRSAAGPDTQGREPVEAAAVVAAAAAAAAPAGRSMRGRAAKQASSRSPSISSPQLRSIACGSPFRGAFRLD